MKKYINKNSLFATIPYSLFFVVTWFAFPVTAIYASNVGEFNIPYFRVIPGIIFISIIIFILLTLLSMFIYTSRVWKLFRGLLFGSTLVIYAQQNFLNPYLPSFDGADIGWFWSSHIKSSIAYSIAFLIAIIFIIIITSIKNSIFDKYLHYVALFIMGMQLLTLPVLLLQNPWHNKYSNGYTNEGEFDLGKNNNVVLFIIDTVGSEVYDSYYETNSELVSEKLANFTYYKDMIAGGAPTKRALPVLLTGMEYDGLQSIDQYYSDAWGNTDLYDVLHEKGYDIRLYTSAKGNVKNVPDHYFDNNVDIERKIADRGVFYYQLYKIAAFNYMPMTIKPLFWDDTKAVTDAIKQYSSEGANVYTNDNSEFNDAVENTNKLELNYDNTFRIIHLRGIHDLTTEAEKLSTMDYCMNSVYSYMELMKAAGIYDNSTIIITADHGVHEENNFEANPMTLIKLAGESHEYCENTAPVCFRNVFATIASAMLPADKAIEYGPTVNDIDKTSDVERLHSVDTDIRQRNESKLASLVDYYSEDSLRIKLQNADSLVWEPWDPYKINRVLYNIGDKIDFINDNELAQLINERMYKTENGKCASNEFTMCLASNFDSNKDYTFHFMYSNFLGKKQRAKIYCNGNMIGDIECDSNNINKDISLAISKDYLTDEACVIRIIFPTAITPNMLDRNNDDKRILSVTFTHMWID